MGKRMGGPTKQSFLHGALILLVAVAIVKVIGALFKIPLNLIITPVGMGYFSTAYNLYNPIFSLATAGFPIAIARLVSENYARGRFRDIRQIHKVSIPIFLALGLLAFCLMFFGAKPYVSYATDSGDMNALPAIYCYPCDLIQQHGGHLPRLLRGPAQYRTPPPSPKWWKRCSSWYWGWRAHI